MKAIAVCLGLAVAEGLLVGHVAMSSRRTAKVEAEPALSLSTASASLVAPSLEALTGLASESGAAAAAAAAAALAASSADLEAEFARLSEKVAATGELTKRQLTQQNGEIQRQLSQQVTASQSQWKASQSQVQTELDAYKRSAEEQLFASKDAVREQLVASNADFQKQLSAQMSSNAQDLDVAAKSLKWTLKSNLEALKAGGADFAVEAPSKAAQYSNEFARYSSEAAQLSAARSTKASEEALAWAAESAKQSLAAFRDALLWYRDAAAVGEKDVVKLLTDSTSALTALLERNVSPETFALLQQYAGPLAAVTSTLVLVSSARSRQPQQGDYAYIASKGSRFLAVDAAAKKAFTAYCLQFDKSYATEAEWNAHFLRWRARADQINAYNSAEGSLRLALNAFADLPGDDLAF